VGEVFLVAGFQLQQEVLPADGRLLPINQYLALFEIIGVLYGGDGVTTFALPDVRAAAPSGLTYVICISGIISS
jgi:microcystin-dependent protein